MAHINTWQPKPPPQLIFSNAALHWSPGHDRLIPRLFAALAPGGTLAVQMPAQRGQPSHQTMCAAAAAIRPDLFTSWSPFPGPLARSDYAALLPGAEMDIWVTDYQQRLAPSHGTHPVRRFVSATGARPILAALSEGETHDFEAAWDAALSAANPLAGDGSCWFPFRRLFFTVRRA